MGAHKRWPLPLARKRQCLATLLLMSVLARDPAFAGEPGDAMFVDEPRPVLKAHRLEIGALAGLSLNQLFTRYLSFGAELRYHLSETLSLAADAHRFLTQSNDRAHQVTALYGRPATGAQLTYAAGGSISYVFGYGKAVFANRYIGHWEPIVSLGAGALANTVTVRGESDARISSTPFYVSGDIGFRFFVGQSAAVRIEVRDYVFRDRLGPIARAPDESQFSALSRRPKQVINAVIMSACFSLLLPLSRRGERDR